MISQGRQVGSFLVVLFLTACGSSQNGWKSFPVPIYTEASLASNSNFNSDFKDAMTFWEGKAGKQLFDYRGSWSGSTPYVGTPASPQAVVDNVVFFQSPWPFQPTIVGQTMVTSAQTEIQAAMVMVNPNAAFCSGDCTGQPQFTSERKVLAHELGHFLGLNHVQDTANLMYPTSLPGGTLGEVTIDETAFHALIDGR